MRTNIAPAFIKFASSNSDRPVTMIGPLPVPTKYVACICRQLALEFPMGPNHHSIAFALLAVQLPDAGDPMVQSEDVLSIYTFPFAHLQHLLLFRSQTDVP